MDHIIKNCSAPCVAKISQQDYRQKVEQACEFLQGRTQEMMDELSVQIQTLCQARP
jgi:excinuclease ABC subunit C